MPKKIFPISKILILISWGFILGVFLGSVFDFTLKFLLAGGVIILGTVLLRNRYGLYLFFVFIGILLGFLRLGSELRKENGLEEVVEFSGTVIVERVVERDDRYQKIISSFEHFNKEFGFILFAKLNPKISYGDKLRISCEMKIPENKYEKFNYRRFLASKNIFYICNDRDLFKVKQEETWGFKKVIFKIRTSFEERINRLLPATEGAYLAGLLLGGDDRLPEDVAEDFRKTGTLHTVAVSGYNITIIASVMMWLAILLGFWRKQAFYLSVIGIIVFVIMIGSPTPAVRAGVMGVLLLWAVQKGRLANSVEIIVITAVIMLLFSPFLLLYDAGFQLSFLATLGIVLIYTPLSKLFKIENDFLELKSIVLVTVSAQLGVLGILVYTFETISLIAIIANLIILPLIPFIMFLGFFSIGISFLLPTVAFYLNLFTWVLLKFEILVIAFLAKIPFAELKLGNIGAWWLFLYYLFFIGLVFKLKEVADEKDENR